MSSTGVVLDFPGKGGRIIEYLIEQYKKAHPEEDPALVEPHLVAEWARKRGLWTYEPVDPEEVLRRRIARFLKRSYTTDPQGRIVRKHHAVIYEVTTPDGIKRRSRYYEIFDAPVKHMQASLALRRRSALADVQQLDIDFHSYNDNNKRGEKLPPMDYNFNKDLEEMKLPTTYEEPDDELDDEI